MRRSALLLVGSFLAAACAAQGGESDTDQAVSVPSLEEMIREEIRARKSTPPTRIPDPDLDAATDNLNEFLVLLPTVLAKKTAYALKNGTKAFFVDDPDIRRDEERMIRSLMDGIRGIGDAVVRDMARATADARAKAAPSPGSSLACAKSGNCSGGI